MHVYLVHRISSFEVTSYKKNIKLGSHQAILFWRWKLKLSPLLFPGDSTIFKAIFIYHPINFYRELFPTKLILSPNLEEKILS